MGGQDAKRFDIQHEEAGRTFRDGADQILVYGSHVRRENQGAEKGKKELEYGISIMGTAPSPTLLI